MTKLYYGPVSNTIFLLSFLDVGYVDIDWRPKNVTYSVRLPDRPGTYSHLMYIGIL